MSNLMVPIAPGELIDKLTILEIKLEKIDAMQKRVHIQTEYDALTQVATGALEMTQLTELHAELRRINQQLWEVEDDLRAAEAQQTFDNAFVQMARSVYKLNDQRAAVKRQISVICGAEFMEEKSYHGMP